MSTIGFFDSGLGGLSILELAWAQSPEHDYVYLADTANNPYGEKKGDWIQARGLEIVAHLNHVYGCEVIVVACNTATAEAIHEIRLHFPQLKVIGVEPGIKPATLSSKSKSIGILATKATLQSQKFNALMASMPQDVRFIKIPGTGLVEMIEQAHPNREHIQSWLAEHLVEMKESQADTLVLGCTHYPFIKDLIEDHLGPQVQLIDTAQAVVNHLNNLLTSSKGTGMGMGMGMVTPNKDLQEHRGSVLYLCNVDPELFSIKAQKLLRDAPALHARFARLEL